MMKLSGNKGFTLIELIVVIVIIGILAAVAVPAFVDLIAEAQAGAAKGALGAVRSEAVILKAQDAAQNNSAGAWPTSFAAGDFDPSGIPNNPITNSTATVSISATPTNSALLTCAQGWAVGNTVVAARGHYYACIGTNTNGAFTDAHLW